MSDVHALHALKVRVEPNRLLVLCAPPSGERVAALHPDHGEQIGTCRQVGSVTWVMFNHPAKGFLGLPLFGEQGSLEAAWENALVEVLKLPSGNIIETWEELFIS